MITVTSAAQSKLLEILNSEEANESAVRISVVRGPHGCVHGWNLGIANDQGPEDLVESFGELNVIAEAELADALTGASIDYSEDANRIGFTIDAPNSSGHGSGGGCGNHS
jgi:iron-sulfur cluster assembly accessory protein